MKLYNTLSKNVEDFQPQNPPNVSMYSCGPTVYDYAHIGHLLKYVNDDILKRTLTYLGYDVTHVMNITDVGHLESDGDEGEDKFEKGARKYNSSVQDIAKKFTDHFFSSIKALHIIQPSHTPKATDHIQDMIELILKLQEQGFTYETDEAVYFNTTKFEKYGELSGQKLDEKKQQARKDVHVDSQKRNAPDFVLWFKRVGHHANHAMHWDSPWGDGFPGWHIECSAMSMKYLGQTIDIHSGGIDHIPVHHENEIAQSECATGHTFVKYWFHTEFLKVDGTKMSKSLNNMYTLDDVRKKSIDPLALRYLFLQSHYRQELNFTWDSLKAAESALNKLRKAVLQLRSQTQRTHLSEEKLDKVNSYSSAFTKHIEEDLHIPQALALVWEVLKTNIPSEDKLDLILSWDQVFGLELASYEENPDTSTTIPAEVQELAEDRLAARKSKDFAASDALRKHIEDLGYEVIDQGDGYSLRKK